VEDQGTALIVHGWGVAKASLAPEWMHWLRDELESRGMRVVMPSMPNAFTPQLAEWLGTINESLNKLRISPNENLHIVGHSMGGITSMKYVESLPRGTRIGSLTVVASPIDNKMWKPTFDSFYVTPLHLNAIRAKGGKITLIYSQEDDKAPIDDGRRLAKHLRGSTLIEERGKRHFGLADWVLENRPALDAVLNAQASSRQKVKVSPTTR